MAPAFPSLFELGITNRSYNALVDKLHIRYTSELLCHSRDDLLRLPHVGVGTVRDIEAQLAFAGLKLAESHARYCPFCDAIAVSTPAEINHMETAHPDIVAARLAEVDRLY